MYKCLPNPDTYCVRRIPDTLCSLDSPLMVTATGHTQGVIVHLLHVTTLVAMTITLCLKNMLNFGHKVQVSSRKVYNNAESKGSVYQTKRPSGNTGFLKIFGDPSACADPGVTVASARAFSFVFSLSFP